MVNSGKIYSQKTPRTNTASPLQDYACRRGVPRSSRISFYASSFRRISSVSAGDSWRNWWRRNCSRWSGPTGGPGGGSSRASEPKRKHCDIWSSVGNEMRREKWEGQLWVLQTTTSTLEATDGESSLKAANQSCKLKASQKRKIQSDADFAWVIFSISKQFYTTHALVLLQLHCNHKARGWKTM